MKISKSKQELARIIRESGGWLCADFAAQQDDGEVWFSSVKPEWNTGRGCFSMRYESHFTVGTLIHNRHQCILSREEYFHLYPAPDADGWIAWSGGECPVCIDDVVDVMQLDGHTYTARAVNFHWLLKSGSVSVAAYRLHKPDVKPEPCESVTRSIPELEAKPTIEQLATDYRNAKDYAERKQQEADDAKVNAGTKLAELVAAGKVLGLVLSVAGVEPELVITVQVGDEVECVKPNVKPSKYKGMIGTVLEVDDSSTPYLVEFGGEENIWCHEVKFISRP